VPAITKIMSFSSIFASTKTVFKRSALCPLPLHILIISYGVAVFIEFFLLQPWRNIPPLMNVPAFVALPLGAFFLTYVANACVQYAAFGADQRPIDTPQPSKSGQTAGWITVVVLSLIVWGLSAGLLLNRPLNVFGDEEFHLTHLMDIDTYFAEAYIHLHTVKSGVGDMHYPGVLYVIAINSAALLPQDMKLGAYRGSLLIWYVGFNSLVYSFASKFFARREALLFTLSSVLSGCLLTYTTDFYLDISLAFFFLLMSVNLYGGFAYAMAAGLATLTRDSAVPASLLTAMVLGIVLLLQKTSRPRRWADVALLAGLAAGPGLLFTLIKQTTTNSDDRVRLAFEHIAHQHYGLFLLSLPVYGSPIIIGGALATLSPRLWKSNKALLVIWGSIAAELLIYALFVPTWMPWSRNFLMFIGQITVLAAIGLHALAKTRPAMQKFMPYLLGISAVFQAGILIAYFNNNMIFHENEVWLPYDRLLDCMDKNADKLAGNSIAVQTPMHFPSSFVYELNRHYRQQLPMTFMPILWQGKSFDEKNFMTFTDAVARMDKSHFLIFHWMRPSSFVEAVHATPTVERPSQTELADFEVLCSYDDQHSEGRNGVMLVERKNHESTTP
jgi:hypothetical protein